MNPWLLKLADGTAFFIGMGMVATACGSRLWLQGKIWRSLANIVALVGAVLIAFSAPPLPLFLYVVWIATFVTAFVCVNFTWKTHRGPWAKRLSIATVVGLSLAVCGLELPYQFSPTVTVSADTPIYVIGDSISAGTVTGEKVWPELLAEQSGLKVTNLAKSGAKTAAAVAQAQRVPRQPGVVIVEIGGNDLFGATDSHAFEQQLDRLLTAVNTTDHQILMFELPLPPLHNGFGRAQRRQAHRHGVQLIPKRDLARVLGTAGATVDGLHLSTRGHEMMMAQVQKLLKVE